MPQRRTTGPCSTRVSRVDSGVSPESLLTIQSIQRRKTDGSPSFRRDAKNSPPEAGATRRTGGVLSKATGFALFF